MERWQCSCISEIKIDEETISYNCTITLNVILTIINAIGKNLPSRDTQWLPIMTYIHPAENILIPNVAKKKYSDFAGGKKKII
jgi:hypothetical protein